MSSIARYLHRKISGEDRERLHWDPQGGLYAGYKPPFGWTTKKRKYDGISQFNFYEEEYQSLDKIPSCVHPFFDEIDAFTNNLTRSVNKHLLTLLWKVLEMPDDYLWKNVESHGDIQSMKLFGRDNIWRYVKYSPGALVVNIGDTLELVSGGHFRATRHRVHNPPPSQETFERLSIVCFNGSRGDLRMQPSWESPLIKREGCFESQGAYKEFKALQDKGIPIPTNKEWREISIVNTRHPTDEPSFKEVYVDGVKMFETVNQGVRVLQPA
ncbi:uncharacterized protein IL334_005151 [Kwoniella shivajii]|uniref:Isopenicillin N synthase-like Fe(2+) 2OG dioxygenase domain-containing protein n=1 Tax=Kwoniella shivajii TaxID=564305 RepID=A0ABZ1D2T7_9TREE|nr:hypothetical protein IL334_005151 [Kwoniella shivajii]